MESTAKILTKKNTRGRIFGASSPTKYACLLANCRSAVSVYCAKMSSLQTVQLYRKNNTIKFTVPEIKRLRTGDWPNPEQDQGRVVRGPPARGSTSHRRPCPLDWTATNLCRTTDPEWQSPGQELPPPLPAWQRPLPTMRNSTQPSTQADFNIYHHHHHKHTLLKIIRPLLCYAMLRGC